MNKTLKVIPLVCYVVTECTATLAATSAADVVPWLVMRQSAKRGKKSSQALICSEKNIYNHRKRFLKDMAQAQPRTITASDGGALD